MTLASSISDYRLENGRTYHRYADGRKSSHFRSGETSPDSNPDYAYPNDTLEQERFDLQHDVFTMVLQGRLHVSPFTQDNPPRYVLDVGTGTGRWAIEMGDRYPTATIRGFDLSPIQPDHVPENVHFYVDDA